MKKIYNFLYFSRLPVKKLIFLMKEYFLVFFLEVLLRKNSVELRMHLILGAFGAITIKIVGVLLGMCVSVLLARKLSPEGFGSYAYAFSIMSLLAIPVQLGIPTLVLREIARYHQLNQWSLLRGILIAANKLIIFLSIFILLFTSTLAWIFSSRFGDGDLDTFLWAMLLLPVLGLSALREGALQGLRRIIFGLIPEAIVLPLIFITLLLGTLQFRELTPSSAMSLYFLSAVIVFIVGAILLVKAIPREISMVPTKYEYRLWLASLLPLSLLSGLHIINSQIDIFMLGIFSSKDSVGLYRVAFSGAALVLFVMTAIGSVFAPNIARLHSINDFARLQRMVILGARISIFAAVPIALILIIFGGNIISIIYGPEYSKASLPLAILCCGQLINVFFGFVHIILNMMGYERETLKGVLYSLIINIFLDCVLIPKFGASGAAISATASIIAVNAFLFFRLYRLTGISSLPIRLNGKAVI